MNKKVFISMLVLTASFLLSFYIIKIFFTAEFMMSIQNERIVAIGQFIDSNIVLTYVCNSITSFVVYWLYCCACSHRLYLKWYEVLYIILIIIIIRIVSLFDMNMMSILSWVSFMVLSALCNGNIRTSAFIFSTHSVLQGLSIKIRDLPIYLISINSITSILMVFECYLWMILMYVIFNYRK